MALFPCNISPKESGVLKYNLDIWKPGIVNPFVKSGTGNVTDMGDYIDIQATSSSDMWVATDSLIDISNYEYLIIDYEQVTALTSAARTNSVLMMVSTSKTSIAPTGNSYLNLQSAHVKTGQFYCLLNLINAKQVANLSNVYIVIRANNSYNAGHIRINRVGLY